MRLTLEQLSISTDFAETQAWIRHAGGVALVMKLRGPSAFRSPFDHSMFMAARTQMVRFRLPDWEQLLMKPGP